MAEQVRYFSIGLFVVISIILAVFTLIFLGAGNWFKEKVIIETYFDQSVQGLDTGSPVKYRGVKIGQVSRIAIVGDIYSPKLEDSKPSLNLGRYVLVEIALEPTVFHQRSKKQIKKFLNDLTFREGLRLKLAFIGVTGLVYIEADYVDPKENPPLEISWEPNHFYVPSVPNAIARLSESLNDFLASLDEEFFPMLRNLNEGSKNLPNLALKVHTTLDAFNDLMVSEKDNIDEILVNARIASKDIKDLLSLAKQHPSGFIFGDPPPRSRFDK